MITVDREIFTLKIIRTKGLIHHMPDYRVGELSTKGLIHHMPDYRVKW